MPEDLNMQQIEDQLRSYGHWLEQRSDVALSNVDRDTAVFAGGSVDTLEHGRSADDESLFEDERAFGIEPDGFDRPSVGRRLLGAGAAVFVAGAAFFVVTDQRANDGAVTAAGDGANGDAVSAEATSEPEVTAPVLDVQDSQSEASDTSSESATGQAADDQGDGQESNSDASSEGGGADSADAGTEDATTVTTASDASDDAAPTSDPDTSSEAQAPGDPMTFISPRPGNSIDLNLGATFQAAPVDGAVSYTFIGSQNGAEVFRTTVNEPTFLLPGRLAAFTAGWSLEPGLLTVEVVATDGSGSVMAGDTIEVALLAGGGTPRRDVPGQILPTIPTLPQD